jgi:glycosyltransferase involved in cell wall biosynthesis
MMLPASRPKISIVTPSFNQGEFLEETILSIVNQGYPNLEYIIIDGGSIDQSVQIIKKYESQLSYWVSERDTGQAQAINKGLKKCTGDIITWINSDDLLCEHALENIATHFEKKPDVGVIFGDTILFWPNGRNLKKKVSTGGEPFKFFAGMSFSQPSSFFKRQVVDQIGLLDETLHFGLDYDFFLRAACEFQFLRVEETLSKYRLHSSSKTASAPLQFALEWRMIFSKFVRTINQHSRLAQEMRELGLYMAGSDCYKTKKQFDEETSRKIYTYFLFYQIVFFYEGGDFKRAYDISCALKEWDLEFFKQNRISELSWRSRYLPAALIILFRRIKSVWPSFLL